MKHSHSDQHTGKSSFGYFCMTLRKHMNLTQRELGIFLEISEQAIHRWERSKHSPTREHLTQLIAFALQRHAFTPGQEREAAKQLWLAAGQQDDFTAFWIQAQLASAAYASSALAVREPRVAQSEKRRYSQKPPLPSSRFDWGDALDVSDFYGRQTELLQLERWVLQEHCQVVSVLGMGGIGKSALSVSLMRQVAPTFQMGVFRSIRNALPCQDLLTDCLQVLSPQPLPALPSTSDQCIDLLLECFQTRRCLLVLDNLEILLQEHDPEGRYRPGYEDYATLLRRVAETPHQSCLLITSREASPELEQLERRQVGVYGLRLGGLELDACKNLFEEKGLAGTVQDQAQLAQLYAGNPLALKIVAEIIVELFGGEISAFLEQETVIFSTIRDVLAEQYSRLSALEQALLIWLAIGREPLHIVELHMMLIPPVAEGEVREALEALQRRSLVERSKQQATFTLQSVILEYVTEVLVEQVSEQIQHALWEHLIRYALEQARAKEYVRQAQERLIVSPILVHLQAIYQGTKAVEELLLQLLSQLRTREQEEQGYGPANLITLLRGLRGHLRGLDLSGLAIRGAYLQSVEMQDTTLSGALIQDSVFTEAFDATLAVATSSNGQYWAAGSKRGEVRVWYGGGQTLHLVRQAHTANTYALAFSPDAHLLASGSFDGSITLWDVASGAPLWSVWHTKGTNCLAFAPHGEMLASGGHDATVRLWDTQQGIHLQDLSHPGPIFSLAWSPNGTLLVSGDFEGTLRWWEMRTPQAATCLRRRLEHSNWVRGLAFAPNGSALASGSWDGTVKLWDVKSQRVRQTLVGHTERVQSLAWSPDGQTLASGGFDHMIWLWDAKEGRTRMVLRGHTAVVNGLAFTPDSRHLLSGSEDGTLRLWEVASGQCIRIIQGYAATLYDIDWSPDGTQLASAGSDTLVTIWDMSSGMPSVLRGHRWTVYGVGWSPDGGLLASSGWDNTIRLWDPTTRTCIHVLHDIDHPDTLFSGVAWSPDGHQLASGTFLRGVLVWDGATRTQRWMKHAQATWVRRVAWSPDSTRLAGGDEDGNVYLWNTADGSQILQLQRHHGAVMSVAWSPDGAQLASGCGSRDSGELVVWDMRTGEPIRSLKGHSGVVSAVTWSSSGTLLISGGSDGMLRWWDVSRGACVRVRQAHQGMIQSLKVSPDGRWLTSCGDDGSIVRWDLQCGESLHMLRRDRPYERLNIGGVRGLTEAQKATLRMLGAIECAPAE
ncbi:hypothetical protein KSD_46300 [Ktedonobacter sp. SOSP1-85]|uniref:NACHT and WD40 repeat domain-containing protein n=1 Tax=Ktedonobacter sp. SOSP1-85 TaxID=2778367 RepID=UPI001915A939|nr:NB-ARC domain-containing protein [Ktedonobacter sp. SOSP1-85]GHO76859.1 hypothetical protein KSD_46300 [Ktedonobacter sp. SOSP1-85]